MRFLLLFAAAFTLAAQSPVATLNRLYREYYEFLVRESPEMATSVGRTEFNDKWTDYSPAAALRRDKGYQDFLARAKRFKTETLPAAERLNHRLFLREVEDRVSRAELINYFDPVNHFFGPHLDIFSTMPIAPAATVKVGWKFNKNFPAGEKGSLNLSVNGRIHLIVRKSVSPYQQLLPAEFEGYHIPGEAILAAYCWQAGYGDVVYVIKKSGRLEVYRREMDESETGLFPVKKIASFPLS